MSKRKKTPEFKTEAEERTFWETHDSSDYVDWSQAKPASFPKLKPSTIKSWLKDDVDESRAG
mgnify:FL=1|jgi:hypothetical protein